VGSRAASTIEQTLIRVLVNALPGCVSGFLVLSTSVGPKTGSKYFRGFPYRALLPAVSAA
jgi:hypothetical protein